MRHRALGMVEEDPHRRLVSEGGELRRRSRAPMASLTSSSIRLVTVTVLNESPKVLCEIAIPRGSNARVFVDHISDMPRLHFLF